MAAEQIGAVYASSNKAEGNTIVAFKQMGDGSLATLGEFKSGGKGTGKPKAKAVWKKEKPAGDAPRKGKGKPTTSATTPGGEKSYKRASDPSKRFTPPNKIGKQGGKSGPKSK